VKSASLKEGIKHEEQKHHGKDMQVIGKIFHSTEQS